jgi:hypothetical protein
LNCHTGIDGRLQHRTMEWQHLLTIAGGPFGETNGIDTIVQSRGKLRCHAMGCPMRTAPDEQGLRVGTQPTDQRPLAYLFLGDEGTRQYSIDDKDIEP